MRFEFKLPDLAEGMVEGEVVSWLVAAGDAVHAEQPIVEVMTDKATVVIESPYEGKVVELAYAAGDIATVGKTLFVMQVDGEIAPTQDISVGPVLQGADAAATPTPAEAPAAAKPEPRREPRDRPRIERVQRGTSKVLATPATRRLARELGVDIGTVRATGAHGRVTKQDVRSHTEVVPSAAAAPTQERPRAAVEAIAPAAAAPAVAYAYVPSVAPAKEGEERVKLRGLRRAIHDTMARSMHTAAHFTYVDEVDCDNLVVARARLKEAAKARGVRLSYLPFIAKATLLALRRFPKMNASLDDAAGEIVLKRHVHLGIAAATPAGLVVPVVKHADQLTLLDLAGHIQSLGQGARDGRLRPDQLKGSTITITSLGRLGGLFATPIINHPEVAILGVHQMQKRAVVRDDAIVARQMMNLSLSFDHRVIDGHEGAAFAQAIKVYLEDPELMLLEMA